jgi:hypothetical protein
MLADGGNAALCTSQGQLASFPLVDPLSSETVRRPLRTIPPPCHWNSEMLSLSHFVPSSLMILATQYQQL